MANNTPQLGMIISIFRDLALRHKMINDFFVGERFDIGASNPLKFPYLWLSYDQSVISGAINSNAQTITYVMQVAVMDKIKKGDSNYDNILSDTHYILSTIISEMVQHQYYANLNIKLDGDIIFNAAQEFSDDNSNGWIATFRLKVPMRYTYCNSPIEPITGYQTSYENGIATYRLQGAQGPQGLIGFRGFQGFDGAQGTQGSTGSQGPQGQAGVSSGYYCNNWRFLNNTVDSDPGSGKFKLNNLDPTLATEIYISDITYTGNDVRIFLENIIGTGSTLYLQNQDDGSVWSKYTVSGIDLHVDYIHYNVVYIGGSGTFQNNHQVTICKYPSSSGSGGGSTGPQGFQGLQGNQGTEGTNPANTFSWIVSKVGAIPNLGRFNTGADINWVDLVGDDLYFNREAYNGLLSPITATYIDIQDWALSLKSYFNTGSTILFQVRSRTNPSNFGLYELGYIEYEDTYANAWTIRFSNLITSTGSGLIENDICQFAYDTIGLNGAQGPQGNDGSNGPQGFQGRQGSQGFQGNQGFQGPSSGGTGAQGLQGFQGNSGTYIKKDNITLTQSTWTFSTPYWNYTITDSDITSQDNFIIYTPYMTNISTVIDAIIYPYILVATGSATLYSENQPSGNIIGEMVILK